MGRLIDADAMLARNEHSIYDTTDLEEMLKNEPTVYDVNKVIKQLETIRQRREENAKRYLENGNEMLEYGANCEICALDRAIATIKGEYNNK